MIGVEGGGQIDGNLSILRTYAALGAGYLTLTHARTIEWADSATDNPQHDGLTPFGEQIVLQALDPVVERLHRGEVSVHDDVEHVGREPRDARPVRCCEHRRQSIRVA